MFRNVHRPTVTDFDTPYNSFVSHIETDRPKRLRQNYGMRNKWLSDRIKELDKTQAALAKQLGLGRARISDIIVGRRAIAASEVTTIAQFLEWPEATVLRHIAAAEGKTSFTPNAAPSDLASFPVKVIGEVQAGVFKETLEFPPDEQYETYALADPRYRGTPHFALRVRGPSMNQVYPEGSHVICVPLIHLGEGYIPESGRRVVVERRNSHGEVEATVKEIVFDPSGQPWLWPRSDHPQFQQPWKLPVGDNGHGFDDGEDIRISALVIQSVRME